MPLLLPSIILFWVKCKCFVITLYQECHFIMLQHQSPDYQSICCLLSDIKTSGQNHLNVRQNSSWVCGIHILIWLGLQQRTDMNQNKPYPTTFIKNPHLKISWTLWVFLGGVGRVLNLCWKLRAVRMFECHMPYLLQTLSEVMVTPVYAWQPMQAVVRTYWGFVQLILFNLYFIYLILCTVWCCSRKYGHGYTKYWSWANISLWIST
jgi:hypothetical protein